MAGKRTAQGSSNGKRRREHGAAPGAPTPAEPPRPVARRSFVDVDPWAMLLEQFTELPDETGQDEAKTPKRK